MRVSPASVSRSSSLASSILRSVGNAASCVVPQRLRGAGDAVGLGEAGPLVDGAERDVVARLGEHLVDRARVERAGVGEPGAAVADDAHADALVLRRHEVLDVAAVHADLGLAAARDVGLDLLAGVRLGDDLVGERLRQRLARSARRPRLLIAGRSRRSVQGGDPQRRLAGADGHALAVLAARARTAHGEVVGDGVDVAQRLRAVADEVGLAQRLGDLAVLDEVRLGHAEHEVAARRVDLPAAEAGDVHAVLGRADDVVGVAGAVGDERVRHPHHRQVHVALAPAVAARRPALLARPEVVPHVVGEDAVLDEHVALRRVALVVDRERAPLAGHRAVVDDGDERRGDELADLAGVHAGALGDVVGLEAVAARLVEQHAAGAVLDDDRHRARRRRAGRRAW